MQVWSDLDGVIANFDARVLEMFGKSPKGFANNEELWSTINAVSDFWQGIQMLPNAMRLWAVLAPFNPIIITGCPKDNFDAAAANKKAWVKNNLGDNIKVITCLSRDKQNFMTGQGDILIDDFMSNIKRWRKAGGYGILYKNCDQAITDFQTVIAMRSNYNV
jgi:hypothetical protein